MKIVQLLPSVSSGDAIGNEALEINRILIELGYDAGIYCEHNNLETSSMAKHYKEMPNLGYDDMLIYHLSIGTDLSRQIETYRCRKVCIYHNITPPNYFLPYCRKTFRLTRQGLEQAQYLADTFDYCLADSEYNKRHLLEMGWTCPIHVMPPLVDFEKYRQKPSSGILRRYAFDDCINFLFVGRIAPNKKHEDLIAALYHYRTHFSTNARLFLVGSWEGMERYYDKLIAYAKQLGVEDHVVVTGRVSFDEVLAYYKLANVFLCASEHEGFCVPLVEAMHFGLPIVAFPDAAIPETLGDSGILLDERNPVLMAAAADKLVGDTGLREQVIAGHHKRLEVFSYRSLCGLFHEHLKTSSQMSLAPRTYNRHQRIVHVMNAFDYGDAVSTSLLNTHKLLLELGYQSEIYSKWRHDGVAEHWNDIQNLQVKSSDILIYHCSGLNHVQDEINRLDCIKVLHYHNITPAELLNPYDPSYNTENAFEQLRKNIDEYHYIAADSRYNIDSLQEITGRAFINADVLPIVAPFNSFKIKPGDKIRNTKGVRFLFVGRIAANKKIEDVIGVFNEYYTRHDNGASLYLVGNNTGDNEWSNAYYAHLCDVLSHLPCRNNVHFTGKVDDAELHSQYQSADVFLCMSEHEGFCVPILEAMSYQIPVFAYDSSAIASTMDGAGVLLHYKNYESIANWIFNFFQDEHVYSNVVSAQNRRLAKLNKEYYTTALGVLVDKWSGNYVYHSVSIVICTYNRDAFLSRTLNSLSRLAYKNFEIVVVNGPSTDNTADVLRRYAKVIKIANNPEANLSKSRNIGIKAASGDIVAFIDDDAIPDIYWLNDIVDYYNANKDVRIGGVGGLVWGPGDEHLQAENAYINLDGTASQNNEIPQDYNDPEGTRINYIWGTNATFLRSSLVAVGGFDEQYDYFCDETDLCYRLIKAGYKIIHHPRAYVHHEFAKSHIRANTFDPYHYNWYPIVKNEVYFILKNASGIMSDNEALQIAEASARRRLTDYHTWHKTGCITDAEHKQFTETWEKAYEQGMHDGLHNERKLDYDLKATEPYLQYDPSMLDKKMNICLLSKDDIFANIGGTAKYTYELAKGFVRQGHQVHVITRADERHDYIVEGINVHALAFEDVYVPEGAYSVEIPFTDMWEYPTPQSHLQWSYTIYKKLVRLHKKYGLDIIESVLWDFEGAVAAHMFKGEIPVCVRLQTPLLKVVETQKWELNDDMRTHAAFEKAMMQEAAGIIPISDAIQNTVENLYGLRFDPSKTIKVYLGVDEPAIKSPTVPRRKQVLFIGRLERRKGVHTLFEVLPGLMLRHNDWDMVFVGDCSASDGILGQPYKDWFTEQYKMEPWFERITFAGVVANEVKDAFINECAFLVAPSLYESFGIILIEAMAYGKPVVACNIGGMQEIVRNYEDGLLIDVEKPAQLSSAMDMLLGNEKMRGSMGVNAKQRFCDIFSNDRMIEGTLDAYRMFIHT